MEVYSAEGVWWRPEASQHRVPGTLTSDEDGVQLVVYEPLRPSIPAKVGVSKLEGSEWVATPVVHGHTRDGADITLLDAGSVMSQPVPFAAEVREPHTVAVACIGGHFGGDAFIEARAEFDWLDAWLDPPSIVDDNVPAPTTRRSSASAAQSLPARRSSAARSGSSPAWLAGRDLPPSISIGGPR